MVVKNLGIIELPLRSMVARVEYCRSPCEEEVLARGEIW